MNVKKFIMTVVAVFVAVMITDFVTHQVVLKSAYAETASLWRADADIQGHMCYMMGGQFLVALFLSWIFTHGYKGKGIMEGVRFGLLLGGFETGKTLIMYAVTPYPCSLVTAWIVAGFVQGIVVGCVASLVYKNP